MRQLPLLPIPKPYYGGELVTGKRKTYRPLATKRPIHLVLKSKKDTLFGNAEYVKSEINRIAVRFQLKIDSVAVNFDHIHLVARIPDRQSYIAFIRTLTGLLARKFGRGIWKLLPLSRVLTWGKDYKNTLEYLEKNRREATGVISYEARTDRYRRPKKTG